MTYFANSTLYDPPDPPEIVAMMERDARKRRQKEAERTVALVPQSAYLTAQIDTKRGPAHGPLWMNARFRRPTVGMMILK